MSINDCDPVEDAEVIASNNLLLDEQLKDLKDVDFALLNEIYKDNANDVYMPDDFIESYLDRIEFVHSFMYLPEDSNVWSTPKYNKVSDVEACVLQRDKAWLEASRLNYEVYEAIFEKQPDIGMTIWEWYIASGLASDEDLVIVNDYICSHTTVNSEGDPLFDKNVFIRIYAEWLWNKQV